MTRISTRKLTCILSATLGTCLLVPSASAKSHPDHPYRNSDVDIPISLAVGTIRTPEFPVIHEAYFIMVQAERNLPWLDQVCMMGITTGPLNLAECKKANIDWLLQANWTVLDGDRIVAQGTSTSEADARFDDHMFKFLGMFKGEANKKYVVEVKFTKDGTPLNAANPHLIVILVRKH